MNIYFTTEYGVGIGDINYGGHMGNDRALVVFQDARIKLLRSLGSSEKDIGGNSGIIMVESAVRYIKEVFLHDNLFIDIIVSELKTKKFTLYYKVTRASDKNLVFHGSTTFLAFDYSTRKVVRLPAQFQEKIAKYLGEAETSGMR